MTRPGRAIVTTPSAGSPYAAKPWLRQYPPGLPTHLIPSVTNALGLFRAAVARAADRPAILYFDGRLTYAELDRMSDAVAAMLVGRGFVPGDRLAVYLQNVPQFLLATLGAWKAGGIVVPVNPMNRQRELLLILEDSRPKAMVCLDTLFAEIVADLPEPARPPILFTTSAHGLQSRNDPRVLPVRAPETSAPRATPDDLLEGIAAANGRTAPAIAAPGPSDTAFLVYTSGTTGLPKGAMNTHGNVAFNAHAIATWYSLQDGDPVLALAPLFHVTGLVGHMALSWKLAAPLILCCRFEPGVVLDALAEHRPSFTVSAITAFIALMNHRDASPDRFSSLRVIVSGGAPIPPSVVAEFRRRTGYYIHNGYGLTESNAGVIAVPVGREAPIDLSSGALAIGVPKFDLEAWIADDEGRPVPMGEPGEIVLSGPSIVPGYWHKPDETAAAMRPDGFRTGDIAFMDQNGWFYLVDRKKDVIIASGFKVWPREVEDVLYGHPAVREAAVIGIRDPYRGETVKAVVSLKPGAAATSNDLLDWCRPRLAAYKRPQDIDIVDDLPKTVTGKILRRLLK